ncbi:MAG: retron St85 family RNA-directed DNA polymerase [Candidatus Auribacterota bacterium]
MNIHDLASAIGIHAGYLLNLIKNSDHFYKTYSHKKPSGQFRKIAAPNVEIKAIQRWILKNVLEKESIHEVATGFIKDKSIKDNAQPHISRKYILCMDLKDFFNSITETLVLEVLSGIPSVSDIAQLIAKLCTYKGQLPQGGVTSPCLSNIIFRKYDEKISDFVGKRNIFYTRYADDLTFSSDGWKLLEEVENQLPHILNDSVFSINTEKTRYMRGKNRKIITGLIINSGRLTVGRSRKKLVRSAIFNTIVKRQDPSLNEEINGLISFIEHIEPGYRETIDSYINSLNIKFNRQ